MITYRPAFPSDHDEIVALDGEELGLEEALKNAYVFVATNDQGRVIGAVRAMPTLDSVSYIANLFVHPAYRKTGIGRSLIDFTLEAIGLSAVAVAYTTNDQFWAACGFFSTARLWEKYV